MRDTTPRTRREEVIRAIEHRNPAYVPGWLNFFAAETRQHFGDRLQDLVDEGQDDVIVVVLSTFPPASEMPPDWADEWACTWNRSPDGVGAVSHASPLSESWQGLDDYLTNGLPGLSERDDILDRVAVSRKSNPDRYLMATTYLAVFERLRCLRGTQNLMTDLYLHPSELARLRDAVAGEFAAQIRGIGQRGGDAVLLADDYGTQQAMLISPEHWQRVFRDTYAQLVDEIHAQGMHAWFHSCGYIRPIIPDIIEIGFDLLHPLQPSAMDLCEIAITFGGQICFGGGIDVQALLPVASPKEVETQIRRVIDILDGPQGGYLMAPTNSIMPDTPWENIEAMFRTARSYALEKRAPSLLASRGVDAAQARGNLPPFQGGTEGG